MSYSLTGLVYLLVLGDGVVENDVPGLTSYVTFHVMRSVLRGPGYVLLIFYGNTFVTGALSGVLRHFGFAFRGVLEE